MARPLSFTSQNDGSVAQAFGYDLAGHGLANNRLATASSLGVGRSLVYSGLNGRLSALTRTVDGLAFEQAYSYDTYGNRQYSQYPSRTQPGAPGAYGSTQNLPWDPAMALPTLSTFDNLGTYLSYDPVSWGLLSARTPMAKGTLEVDYAYGVDQVRLGSMTTIIPTWLTRTWSYGYDHAGRLTQVLGTDAVNTAGFVQDEEYYTYDPLGRLLTAMARDPWDQATGYGNRGLFQAFGYDPFGNRTQSSTVTATNWAPRAVPPTLVTTTALRAGLAKVTFNQAASPVAAEFLRNQLPATLSNGASTGAVYDPQGNLTQIYPFPGDAGEAVNLGYDALGNVNSVSSVSSGNQVTETYFHDDEGLRMKVVDSLGNIRYNIYDDARRLVAQFAKIGTGPLAWKKDIVYAGTRELGEVSPGGVDVVTLCDHLGSPRFQWDGSTPPTQQKFLAFGELLDDLTSAGKFAKGFTNHEQTDASGLIYMQARFYLPGWGRFASPDPARDQHSDLTQSWNIYSYVRNSPVMAVDPTGMLDEAKEKGAGGSTASKNSATGLTNNETQQKDNTDHGFSNPAPSQTGKSDTTFTVTLNSRKADIPGGGMLDAVGVDHQWISTSDGKAAGMGTTQGVPQSDAPGVKTEVVDHTGQVPTDTKTFSNVDRGAINSYLVIGSPTGRWVPGVNDCNTWAANAISQSTPHDVTAQIPIGTAMAGATNIPIFSSITIHNVVVYANGSMHQPGE